ncbi:MAG: hypothetical protein GYA15_05115 [Leptolinea sp.]|jgi:hypothetical protein|nr:hypothetical protein [Leptolinea sp.]
MPIPYFYLLALSLLIIHEMDAIRCREWSILPLLSRVKDETGYLVFTATHLPLVLLIFIGLTTGGIFLPVVRILLDSFCVFHIILHAAFRRHPQNHFESGFSLFIIAGTGLAGLLDLGALVL